MVARLRPRGAIGIIIIIISIVIIIIIIVIIIIINCHQSSIIHHHHATACSIAVLAQTQHSNNPLVDPFAACTGALARDAAKEECHGPPTRIMRIARLGVGTPGCTRGAGLREVRSPGQIAAALVRRRKALAQLARQARQSVRR